MKYRKKPVVVEALHFDGSREGAEQIVAWAGHDIAASVLVGNVRHIDISTLEGVMTVTEGDWVIRGVAGEFYPCKPSIFDATYELVQE